MTWLLFFWRFQLQLEWQPLTALQGQTWYKVASGSLLAGYVSFQWMLALLRANRWARAARALYAWHRAAGVLAPVLLLLHSTRLGYGYLLGLSAVYVANNVWGLMSPSAYPRLKAWVPSWLITHIALSVLLVGLVGYHVWTVVTYE
ncbi:MAG: hypothetical protein ABW133_19175 [Polyangiaceae bacterium]